MKLVKRLFCIGILAVILCTAMAGFAFADGENGLWVRVINSGENKAQVQILTNTAIAYGQLELYYDSSNLTYADVQVDAAYVDVYAVHNDPSGVLHLEWFAPTYETGTEVCLITVEFVCQGQEIRFNHRGNAQDAAGNAVQVLGMLRTGMLRTVVSKAQRVDKRAYTEDTCAVLEQALAEAKQVLDNKMATQQQVDAAVEGLNNAISGLRTIEQDVEEPKASLLPVLIVLLLSAVGLLVCVLLKIKKVFADRTETAEDVEDSEPEISEQESFEQETTEPEVFEQEIPNSESTEPEAPEN